MFTGIIEEIGTVREFSKKNENALIVIECKNVLDSLKTGDSVAIDGVCQTVVSFNSNSFTAQVSSETLNVTTFANFKIGQKVNLERALTLSTRLGGHIVQGHIDGCAKVKSVEKLNDFYNLKFEIDSNLINYIVKKGAVAINGISLTVADTYQNEFNVALIPHTFENTSLKYLKSGDFVNIEVDVLAKYVEKFLLRDNNNCRHSIDENFLIENGF